MAHLAVSIAVLDDKLPGKGKNIETALGIEKVTGPPREKTPPSPEQ